MIVEAKRHDLDSGLGQCAAQMVAAGLFNQQAGHPIKPLWGCVTSGDLWLLLRLDAKGLRIDRKPIFIDDLGRILAAFRAALASADETV